MLHRVVRSMTVREAALVLAACCGFTAPALGESDVLAPAGDYASGYQADDYFTNQGSIDAFDVRGNQVALWNTSGVQIINRTTGALQESLGGAPQDWLDSLPLEVDVFINFTTFDPSGDSLWVGFSTGGNVDDRIYQVADVGGNWQWEHKATLAGNLELDFYGGEVYASANPAAPLWGAEAAVYRIDTSMPGGVPATTHDLIAEIGGYTAGLAFDADGNLYYGTYVGDWTNGISSGVLYQFMAADVAGAFGDDSLDIDDAVKLADLAQGANDVEVDAAGHLLFTINGIGGPNYVGIWDGENTGDGNNYDIIAEGIANDGNFFSSLQAYGDFTADGMLYVNDRNFGAPFPGLVGIHAVPEPSTIAMLVGASLCGMFWWRRRRNSTTTGFSR